MTDAFFVSDLHGRQERYQALFAQVTEEGPQALFLGGDLLPSGLLGTETDVFVDEVLAAGFRDLRRDLGARYPRVFLILGNDDPRREEPAVESAARDGLWEYVHARHVAWDKWRVFGYACIPPTPFALKDWERYDMGRHIDVGCLSPEEGSRTAPARASDVKWGTIREDLDRLAGHGALADAIFLFHAPPYATRLDRAALDGRRVDHAPVDVHVGSIAMRRFIEARQPRITLHGHVHESARLTGAWHQRLGATHALSAAHDGPELALVRFSPEHPEAASRELVAVSPAAAPEPAGAPRR